jgi:hypothetical protein
MRWRGGSMKLSPTLLQGMVDLKMGKRSAGVGSAADKAMRATGRRQRRRSALAVRAKRVALTVGRPLAFPCHLTLQACERLHQPPQADFELDYSAMKKDAEFCEFGQVPQMRDRGNQREDPGLDGKKAAETPYCFEIESCQPRSLTPFKTRDMRRRRPKRKPRFGGRDVLSSSQSAIALGGRKRETRRPA